jgi:hypothetical protein
MNVRKTLITLAIAAAAAPAAFANNFVGGELGYDTHPVDSLTRAQVKKDFESFRAHPVLADGTVLMQGEMGYVSADQGAFADRYPAGPHTHVLGNNAAQPNTQAAAQQMTQAELRAYQEQYIN